MNELDVRRAHLLALSDELGELEANLAVVDGGRNHGCNKTNVSVNRRECTRLMAMARTLDEADELSGAATNAVQGIASSSSGL